MLCIGTKRGKNLGLVYDPSGAILGRVVRQSRVAAGTKGVHAPFYTALIVLPNGDTVGCSLGTRHPDRWSAARAIRKFHDTYDLPDDHHIGSILTSAFKRNYWRDCALPYQTIR